MKTARIIILSLAAALLCSCAGDKKTDVDRQIAEYAQIKIATPDLSGITDNGKEVLNLYRFAADIADGIYWKQYFGDKSLMEGLSRRDLREFAMINYGPWNRIDGKPFVEGYGERPAGVGFYPASMTSEEFSSLNLPDKDSPYTLIRQGEDGQFSTVWFHDEFAPEVEKIAHYLTAAADITIKEDVREYLSKKAVALKTDDYYESDIAWLEMDDSKMDLVIGPNETNDDQLAGLKRSYGALVLLKDLKKTELLNKYTALIPGLQKDLPCEERYKTFQPGSSSNIFVCDVLYDAGSYNAGIKEIAINLPYDKRVQEEKGTRTIILGNILDAKFSHIIAPVGNLFFQDEDREYVDQDAFRLNIAFREVAHGLGAKTTVDGGQSVEQALGSHALTWEEAKANAVGNFLLCELIDNHDVDAIITKKSAVATFVASLLRSQRYGMAEALGRGNAMILNYLISNGALSRNNAGKYLIDYPKTEEALSDLCGIILRTQAEGDVAFAEKFEAQYATTPAAYEEDRTLMRLENIPSDIRLSYE